MCGIIIRDNTRRFPLRAIFISLLQKPDIIRRLARGFAFANNISGQRVQRRKKRCRPVPFIICRLPFGNMGSMGRIGCVRSSACIRDFSSTRSIITFSGGSKYNPAHL
jgi:hypothetical protein